MISCMFHKSLFVHRSCMSLNRTEKVRKNHFVIILIYREKENLEERRQLTSFRLLDGMLKDVIIFRINFLWEESFALRWRSGIFPIHRANKYFTSRKIHRFIIASSVPSFVSNYRIFWVTSAIKKLPVDHHHPFATITHLQASIIPCILIKESPA